MILESNKKNNTVPEFPSFSEGTLLSIAWTSGVLAVIGLTIAFYWILGADTSKIMQQRAGTLAPLGAGLIAVVTFVTFMYRSKLIERQVEEQRRANNAAARVEVASIFQTASVSLLSKKFEEKKVGLATLAVVVETGDPSFGPIAWRLIEEEFQRLFENGRAKELEAVHKIIGNAGIKAAKHQFERDFLSLEWPESKGTSERTRIPWHSGFPSGYYRSAEIEIFENTNKISHRFDNCKIYNADHNIYKPEIYVDIRFHSCQIVGFSVHAISYPSSYTRCDFSGCEFQSLGWISQSHFQDCFYKPEIPPVFNGEPLDGAILKDLFIRGLRPLS